MLANAADPELAVFACYLFSCLNVYTLVHGTGRLETVYKQVYALDAIRSLPVDLFEKLFLEKLAEVSERRRKRCIVNTSKSAPEVH